MPASVAIESHWGSVIGPRYQGGNPTDVEERKRSRLRFASSCKNRWQKQQTIESGALCRSIAAELLDYRFWRALTFPPKRQIGLSGRLLTGDRATFLPFRNDTWNGGLSLLVDFQPFLGLVGRRALPTGPHTASGISSLALCYRACKRRHRCRLPEAAVGLR